ncbi:hypothetical protein NBRC116494_08090 [Aurantivibrio plasticivorans]
MNKRVNTLMSPKSSSAGFTLIEVMVSLLLSAILLYGVITIFDSNRRSSNYQTSISRVQESARIAVELMTRDIRMADFWGCNKSAGSVTNHLSTADPDYDASIINNWGSNGLAAQNDVTSLTIGTITVKDGTDVITLRGSATLEGAQITKPYMNTSSAAVHVRKGTNISNGQILLISDCSGADLFSNTQANTPTSGTVAHNTGTLSVVGSVQNATQNFSKTYKGDAQITSPYTKTYFIGESGGGATWSLYRRYNTGVSQEVIRGVTDMQIFFGEDTSTNQSVNTYVDADSVTDMENVISVRAQLQIQSGDTGIEGAPLERTFYAVSSIRNRVL